MNSSYILAALLTAMLVGAMAFTANLGMYAPVYAGNTEEDSKNADSESENAEAKDDDKGDEENDDDAEDEDTEDDGEFTTNFRIEDCTFTTEGTNPFLILEPDYQLVLAGEDEEGTEVELAITVLDETEEADGVETRVVEERETEDGELVEVSRNFFAICEETNSVFYFGEDVDIFEDGEIVSHEGAWRAGEEDATAGIIMPGTTLLGARYHQEVAPDVAEDRAEIIEDDEELETPAGTFEDVLVVRETTPLEPDVEEFKFHAPGVGLIQDETLQLEEFGFIE